MKLLVVDDDPDALVLASFLLGRREGWSIVTATDGSAALGLALAERPDVVLLDYFLGDENGLEVLERFRTEPVLAEIPVIFLSGKGEAFGERFEEAGALGVIAKPFDPTTLVDRVSALLARDRASEGGVAAI